MSASVEATSGKPRLHAASCAGSALLCDPFHEAPFVLGPVEVADLLRACSSVASTSTAQGSLVRAYTLQRQSAGEQLVEFYDEVDGGDHACFVVGSCTNMSSAPAI